MRGYCSQFFVQFAAVVVFTTGSAAKDKLPLPPQIMTAKTGLHRQPEARPLWVRP